MIEPRALRQRRLINEHNELMKFSSDIICIEPLGNQPHEMYRLTFNIRTIISPAPAYRDKTICILTIPPGYPDVVPKIAVAEGSMPPPWHVNWYMGGTWCFGYWTREESLVNYIYRCAKTIQFNPEITNTGSAANRDAIPFWNANKDNGRIIPSDTKNIPAIDVQTPTISIRSQIKPKINILKN